MSIQTLPIETLSQIFLYLNPASLHNSRRVCAKWNTCIKKYLWKRHFLYFTAKLERNWSVTSPNYSISNSAIQINPMFSTIISTSQNSVMLGSSKNEAPTLEQKFLMINLITNNTWLITQEVEEYSPMNIKTNDELIIIYFNSKL